MSERYTFSDRYVFVPHLICFEGKIDKTFKVGNSLMRVDCVPGWADEKS